MRCPYCGRAAEVKEVVELNLARYGGSARARTKCCGKMIRVVSTVIFKCTETTQEGKDDWGN